MAEPTNALRCPHCESRLSVSETSSGGRIVSITGFGRSVEDSAAALERFQPPDDGPDIICPACGRRFDGSILSRLPPLRRGSL